MEDFGHGGGRFVVAAEGVGQAGVGVAGDVALGDAGELLDVGTHGTTAEGAVDANGEGTRVTDAVVECLGCLAREGAAGGVGDGDADHDGQAEGATLEDLVDGEEGGLGVEGVEDGFDEQDVGAGVDEGLDLLGVGGDDLVPSDGAVVGPVDVGRHGEGAVERADGAGDEATATGGGGRGGGGGAAGAGDGGVVELGDDLLEMVIGHADGGGGETVGLDDVGSGGEVGGVDLFDHGRLGEAEEVVVALQIVGKVLETLAAEVGLGQAVGLHHRAHGPVEHGDAPREELAQGGEGWVLGESGGDGCGGHGW